MGWYMRRWPCLNIALSKTVLHMSVGMTVAITNSLSDFGDGVVSPLRSVLREH